MSMTDDLLKKYNVSMNDLTPDEMESFFNLLKATETRELDLPKVKVYLRDLITALEREIVKTDEWEPYFFGMFRRESRKHLYLKARLNNYLTLEDFVTSPERARRVLEEATERLGKKPQVSGL